MSRKTISFFQRKMFNYKVSLILFDIQPEQFNEVYLLIFWGFFLDTKSTFYTDIARAISTKYTEVALFFNKIQDTEGHGWQVANVDSGHDVRDISLVCFLASDWLIGPHLASYWSARDE